MWILVGVKGVAAHPTSLLMRSGWVYAAPSHSVLHNSFQIMWSGAWAGGVFGLHTPSAGLDLFRAKADSLPPRPCLSTGAFGSPAYAP